MKVKQFIERHREHWLIKVVCFVAAIILYMLYQFYTVEKKAFLVPLQIHAENGIVAAGSHPNEVRVFVRARPEDIATLHEGDFSAYLDLDYLTTDGTYRVPVFVTLSENAIAIDPLEITVSPELIELDVEEQISAFVPVQPLVSGTPAHGYMLQSVRTTPAEAMLTGPRSMVEQCKRLQTRPVSADGLTTTKVVTAQLESAGVFLQSDIDATVSVELEIAPVTVERTYERLSVHFTNVNSRLQAHTSETLSLTVSGPQLAVERYTPASSVFTANCAGISEAGFFEVPLSASVPSQFKVVAGTVPKTITVRFTEKALPVTEAATTAEGATE